MDQVHVSELPPELVERLPLARKLRLAGRILAGYCAVRWRLLRERRISYAVARLRGAQVGLGAAEEARGGTAATYLRAARLGDSVRRTLRFLPADSRCLMQSLVLVRLLARYGIPTEVVIGVQPGPTFKAHAWVEYCSRPVLPAYEADEDEYQRLVRL